MSAPHDSGRFRGLRASALAKNASSSAEIGWLATELNRGAFLVILVASKYVGLSESKGSSPANATTWRWPA